MIQWFKLKIYLEKIILKIKSENIKPRSYLNPSFDYVFGIKLFRDEIILER